MVARWACEVTETPHKEALKKPLFCEDNSDLTNPTSNHRPDIDIAVSVVYDALKDLCMCVDIVKSFM